MELVNDKGTIRPYLASSLVNLFKLESKSQFSLLKDLSSTKMNNLWINTSVLVTLYSKMFTFIDTNASLKLDGDLLKTMTNYKFNVDHSNPQDRKKIYEFVKEMMFDIKRKGRPKIEINL